MLKKNNCTKKIAAQAGDIALGLDNAWDKEKTSKARKISIGKTLDLAFDSSKPRKYQQM